MTDKLRIVADDRIPFLKGVLEPYADVRYLPGAKIGPGDVRDADALITRTRTKCNAALLEGSRIRLVTTATIGFDHIDADYLAQRGIAWFNAPGCNAASVRQYIASALLGIAARHGFPLAGRTLGVIGVGHVGRLVADLGEAWGMRVLRNDPPRAAREGGDGFSDLETTVREADFLSFHVPLSETTSGMGDAALIAKMKSGAFLINASRGEVVRGDALKDALRARRISGAVLDVWENEPEIDRELLALLEYGTPHIAGYSTDGKANGTSACVRHVAEFFGIPELAGWRPETLPPAPEIVPVPAGLSGESARKFVLDQYYDIAEDDRALRADPAKFEALRGGYRIRREAPPERMV